MEIRKPKRGEPVIIAGAGPSGLVSAIALKSRGFEPVIHEAKTGVGTRWKRGMQILENFSEKEDFMEFFEKNGIDVNFFHKPIYDTVLWDSKSNSQTFKSKRPLGYFVRRGPYPESLENGLLKQVLSMGIEVKFNSRLKPGQAHIVATGPRRVDGMGKEVTFQVDMPDRMSVILDPELAPGGYAYLFIVDGEATLALALLGDYKQVDAHFERTVKRFEELEGIEYRGGECAHLYTNFFLKPSLQFGNQRFVGEAGGFQDYLFGFGMRYAMQSGVLAARSIAEDIPYDKLWKRHLGVKQRISLVNRFLYEKFDTWLPSLFISMGGRSSDFRSYLRTWYQKDPIRWSASYPLTAAMKSRKILLKKENLYGAADYES